MSKLRDCLECKGRGRIDRDVGEEPVLCEPCEGTGIQRSRIVRQHKPLKANWAFGGPGELLTVTLSERRQGIAKVIEFVAPPMREIDPCSLTEQEIAEMERRHGWRIKRPRGAGGA